MKSEGSSVSIHEAVQLLQMLWPEPKMERLMLDECGGRFLAQDVYSNLTVPPFDASAMDGFAVRFADCQKVGATLRILGEVPAGARNEFSLQPGEAVRVYTGSPMPIYADHVLIQEHAKVKGDLATVSTAQKKARHIRKAGGDFHRGDKLLSTGIRLDYAHLGLAASGNHSELGVRSRTSIAIIAIGAELRSPGSELSSGQIVESNSHALKKLVEDLGASATRLSISTDSEDCIRSSIIEALEADIVLMVGGASVGKYDLVREVFSSLGGEFIFQKIAIRPGKPTWLGKLGDKIVLGLPGNPTAAMFIAYLLLAPMFRSHSEIQFTEAFLTKDINANGPRETFSRAYLNFDKGRLAVTPLRDQDTSRTLVLTRTNCLLNRPSNDVAKVTGDIVQVVIFKPAIQVT